MSDIFLLFHDAPPSHFHLETGEHLRLKSAKIEKAFSLVFISKSQSDYVPEG